MIGRLLQLLFKRGGPPPVDDKWSLQTPSAISKAQPHNTLRGRIRVPLKGNGSYSFDIVGESNYQDSLAIIAGRKTRDGKEFRCSAQVEPEPANPHDSNAVVVKINGLVVVYFGRADARDYVEQLRSSGLVLSASDVGAMVVGGYKSRDREGHYGVKLDVTRHG